MTDNEIIKALEHCFKKCDSLCPLHSYKDCKYKLLTSALDLINRQKEEIKRLEAKNEELKKFVDEVKSGVFIPARGGGKTSLVRIRIDAARDDAVNMFADRLKQGLPTWLHPYVDMVKKEMKGDE